MKSNLLATKFHRPARHSKQVRRPHLLERLNEGLNTGKLITLVSAPAGFGKTTCVLEWLDGLNLPVTWLSLDRSDDDPVRFFSYFVAALQQVAPNTGRDIEAVLSAGQFPTVDAITTTLINDILRLDHPFLFVLDDFHVIQDPVILQVMESIIANQPHQIHLVLVTREDPLLPLARLRAYNQMTEIRAGDLRFSGSEIGRFLQDVMELSLSEADTAALEQRTEGWVVGLQLAGLSMRGRKDPSSFIAGLTGSHRYILGYLTEEVLNQQAEEIHAFLLQTSILDRLNGDLCDAVTGRADSADLLERLFNANLFLIPLDDDRRWYRYHHLFADLLRTLQNRAPKDQVNDLHRRASQWYAGVGMISEAVEHALAGQDYRQAMNLIENHAMSMVMQGYVKTVDRWVQAVPAERHAHSPRAALAFAGAHLLRGNYGLVAQYLQQAKAAIFPADLGSESGLSENQSLRSEWLAIQSNLLNVQGKAAESLAMAQQALEPAQSGSLPRDFYIRGIAYLGMGGAYRLIDDYPKLVDAYQKAILNSRAADNALSEMLSVTALGLAALQHGQLRFAREVAYQAFHRVDESDSVLPPIAGSIFGVLGMVDYEWGRMAEARTAFQHGLHLNQLGGHNAGVAFARALLARLDLAEGDLQTAAKNTQEAVTLRNLGVPAWLRPEVLAQQVRLDLALGNLSSAEAVLSNLGIDWQAPVTRGLEIYFLAYLRWLLARSQTTAKPGVATDDLTGGIATASRLIESAGQGGRTSISLQALLLRARMHAALGDQAAAGQDLCQALEWAEPKGYLRTFMDEGPEIATLLALVMNQRLLPAQHAPYARRLAAAFLHPVTTDSEAAGQVATCTVIPAAAEPSTPPKPANLVDPATLTEPLTDRELDVLRLIAEGLKYEQIAGRLVISVNTVRFYVKEIYGKLQVNNRTQAVEAARKMGLLQPRD